jgi:hypothetical protein
VQLHSELMITWVLPAVGRIEMNPIQGKPLRYPSFRYILFFPPIISQIWVLDKTDFMTKIILFTQIDTA